MSLNEAKQFLEQVQAHAWTPIVVRRFPLGRQTPRRQRPMSEVIRMHRSTSQRQAKRVCVPVVPDVRGAQTPRPPQRHSTSSFGSLDALHAAGTAVNGALSSQQQQVVQPGPSHHTTPHRVAHHHHNTPTGTMKSMGSNHRMPSIDVVAETDVKHRNSTGSNTSQASSGFESMKSATSSSIQPELTNGGVPWSASVSGAIDQTAGSVRRTPSDWAAGSSSGASSSSGAADSLTASLERLDQHTHAVNVHELMRMGLPDDDIFAMWLSEIGLVDYTPLFVTCGYDLPTATRMTPEDLTAIGVSNPSHRRALTKEIQRIGQLDNWPVRVGPSNHAFREWLAALNLSVYIALFEEQGYTSINDMMSLTFEDLEDIGVKKLGHLKRVLMAVRKLKDHRRSAHAADTITPTCSLVNIRPVPAPAPSGSPAHHIPAHHHGHGSMSTSNLAANNTVNNNNNMSTFNTSSSTNLHQQQHAVSAVNTNNNVMSNSTRAESSNAGSTTPTMATMSRGSTFPRPQRQQQHREILNNRLDQSGTHTVITTEAHVHNHDVRPTAPVRPQQRDPLMFHNYTDVIDEPPKSIKLQLHSPRHILSQQQQHKQEQQQQSRDANNTGDVSHNNIQQHQRAAPCPLSTTDSKQGPGVSGSNHSNGRTETGSSDSDTDADMISIAPMSPISCMASLKQLRSIKATTTQPAESGSSGGDKTPQATVNDDTMMPFASEHDDSGTVRQRHTQRPQQQHCQKVFQNGSVAPTDADVLEDIGGMLQNLSVELDSLLYDKQRPIESK